MAIEFVAGDLFANEYRAQAFAQGCNCQGSMGAGIAKGFRERYPAMYETYRARCRAIPRQFNLGDAWLWKADRGPWVFNLGTQERFWHARATYEAVETALGRMRELADAEQVASIAIPRIGAGYGGLSWKKVRAIVEQVFGGWSGRLIVYEEFVPSEGAPRDATDPAAGTGRGARRSESPAHGPSEASAARGAPRNRPGKNRRIRFRFKALTIACTDHRKSERFYREILGAVPLATDDPGTGCLWIKLGTLTITLMPNAAEASPAEFPTHAMPILWLEVPDLEAAAERFAAEGVRIITPSDGQFLQIADPDGLLIEVWEAEQ